MEPCTFVILGATGDLTHRKLLPALYHLFLQGEITVPFAILGVALDAIDDNRFREIACQGLGPEAVPFCTERVQYQTIGRGEQADYQALAAPGKPNIRWPAIQSHLLPRCRRKRCRPPSLNSARRA